MKSPFISIILPVYNSENTILQTIESIENQSYQNYELIIVNDGSTDNTHNKIKEKILSNDKIKYFDLSNHGVSYSRNYAISKSEGEFIVFIDSDDMFMIYFLETMITEIINKEVDLVACGYTSFNKTEKDVFAKESFITKNKAKYIEELQIYSLFNQIWNKIYKKSIIVKNSIRFDESISIAEDYKFNLDYLQCCKCCSYVNKSLYKYRISNNGLGFSFREDANEIKISLVEYLEYVYSIENYEMDYVYKSYIVQYISYFSRIVDTRNKTSIPSKIDELNSLIHSDKYKLNLNKVKKSGSIPYKFISVIMLCEILPIILTLGLLALIFDRYKKKKFFSVMK